MSSRRRVFLCRRQVFGDSEKYLQEASSPAREAPLRATSPRARRHGPSFDQPLCSRFAQSSLDLDSIASSPMSPRLVSTRLRLGQSRFLDPRAMSSRRTTIHRISPPVLSPHYFAVQRVDGTRVFLVPLSGSNHGGDNVELCRTDKYGTRAFTGRRSFVVPQLWECHIEDVEFASRIDLNDGQPSNGLHRGGLRLLSGAVGALDRDPRLRISTLYDVLEGRRREHIA